MRREEGRRRWRRCRLCRWKSTTTALPALPLPAVLQARRWVEEDRQAIHVETLARLLELLVLSLKEEKTEAAAALE